ncbi:hypothetical protein [Paenarthrobacter sp. NPDC058040]|uniref:hypothetical protein n=1 Tax=unclassified Paenarthrobacter TaxID=2634190 RepID=UPI0036D81FB0
MISKLLRSLRTELKYEAWTRTLYFPLAVVVVALTMSLSGSVSNVSASLDQFRSTEAHAEANGLTLKEALAHPSNVVTQGNQRMLDNPLRFDYEHAYNSLQAFDEENAVGTGLEMITFVVFPVLFFIYGCAVAVSDTRRRILKDRILFQGPVPYVAAKASVVMAVAIGTVVVAAGASWLAAPILRATLLGEFAGELNYRPEIVRVGTPVLQVVFSSSIAAAFGLLGFFVGLVSRAMTLPCLAAGGLLMVAPFAGAYDPRNIISTIGQGVFNFWGGFSPRPSFPVDPGIGLIMLLGCLLLLVGISSAAWWRMTKFV